MRWRIIGGSAGRRVDAERGAVATELAVSLPALLLVLFGLAYIGTMTRMWRTLGDATSYAARTASVTGSDDETLIAALVKERVAGECDEPDVAVVVDDDGEVPIVTVRAACGVGFAPWRPSGGGGLTVSATASMPILRRE